MKIAVACLDSGSVKEITFSRNTDTTDPNSEKPQIETFVGSKGDPVLRTANTDYGIVLCRKRGSVSLVNDDFEVIRELVQRENVVGLVAVGDLLVLASADGAGIAINLRTGEHTCEFGLTPEITTFVGHPSDPQLFLASGLEQLPYLVKIDLQTGESQIQWTAKNPKNTRYDLKERNLVTAATFLPHGNPNWIACVTKHGKLRVYNPSNGSRPLHQLEISKYALKAVVAAGADSVVIADSQAKMALWQVVPTPRLLGHYKGVSGSTWTVETRGRFVAAAGLDRYLRVYETESRAPAGKVFVGEEIASLAFLQDDDEKRLADEDELWDELEMAAKVEKIEDAASDFDGFSD